MSQDQKTPPPKKHTYPLAAMMDDLGVDPNTLHRGQELLSRLEGKPPQEKKAEEPEESKEAALPDLEVFQGSFDDALKKVDDLLPQAAGRRSSQAAELHRQLPLLKGGFVARNPTLHDQLSGRK